MSKKNKGRQGFIPMQHIQRPMQSSIKPATHKQLNMFIWGATPYVITGFGIVMKEILTNLYKSNPGLYNINQVAINYHGDFCDEFEITGGQNGGRFRQWPAVVQTPQGPNLYGQPKALEVLRSLKNIDLDVVFLAEDPFWLGGPVPGQNIAFIDAVRQTLASIGKEYVPIISYFPIDGIPKKSWVDNIAKSDMLITYLKFGAEECIKHTPALNGRINIIPLGVNDTEFFPIPKTDARTFKRVMFGDRFADKFMFLNVNRNQLRKLLPASMLAFKEFKKLVPNSFYYMNMKAVDVGWNLFEVCQSLDLKIGEDVIFPPDFNVNKGLTTEELNKVFNAADVLLTSAVGGGWELAITQAFATRTLVVAPDNTSHTELCGNQTDLSLQRGVLYRSGSNLSQKIVFPYDNEVIRPLPDLDHCVEQLKWAYENAEACEQIKDNAYKWTVEELSWKKNIVPAFHNLFLQAQQVKTLRMQQKIR